NRDVSPLGDDGPALLAATRPGAIAVDNAGRLTIFESQFFRNRMRQVDSAGLIHTIAGGPGNTPLHDRDPPLGFFWQTGIWPLGFFPNGQLVSQYGGALVTVDYASRLGSATAFPVPSRDGSEYFGFEAAGRHVTTRDTVTGATLATLAYT